MINVHYGEIFLKHEVGRFHPERPERLMYIWQKAEKAGIPARIIPPKKAKLEDLYLVHDPWHVERVRTTVLKGLRRLDIDTDVSRNSFEGALWAAGTSIDAATRSAPGEPHFALVRPPGHHATRTESKGFCIFNNIAMAATALLRTGAPRVAIFDFDAHHGDGTQSIFYDSNEVLYVSVHQDPATLYPGTGFPEEVGTGVGEGYNVNMPLPPGSGDGGLLEFARLALEVIEQFQPSHLGFSMGFDGHRRDTISELEYTVSGFYELGRLFLPICSEIPCFGVLEGGYDSFGLGAGFWNFARGLVGTDKPFDEEPTGKPEHMDKYLEWVKRALGDYWDLSRL